MEAGWGTTNTVDAWPLDRDPTRSSQSYITSLGSVGQPKHAAMQEGATGDERNIASLRPANESNTRTPRKAASRGKNRSQQERIARCRSSTTDWNKPQTVTPSPTVALLPSSEDPAAPIHDPHSPLHPRKTLLPASLSPSYSSIDAHTSSLPFSRGVAPYGYYLPGSPSLSILPTRAAVSPMTFCVGTVYSPFLPSPRRAAGSPRGHSSPFVAQSRATAIPVATERGSPRVNGRRSQANGTKIGQRKQQAGGGLAAAQLRKNTNSNRLQTVFNQV